MFAIASLFAALASVRADSIDFGFFIGYGVSILVSLLAFQTAVETLVIRKFVRLEWRVVSRIILWANIWSVVAGIPTKFLQAAVNEWILPKPLHDYMRLLPAASVVATCIFFCVTVGVEWLVTRKKFRKSGAEIEGSHLFTGVLIANVATYAVCGPLFIWATRPTVSIQEFTADAKWARKPVTDFYYISSDTGHLRRARTDGSGDRLVAPFEMESYAINGPETLCVFRTKDEKTYEVELPRGKAKEILWPKESNWHGSVGDVVFGPLGIASRTGETNGWSSWIRDGRYTQTNGWKSLVVPGLGAHLTFYKKGREPVRIVDNPGWTKMSSRGFWNPVFVNERESLFEDYDSTYLVDVEARRVGFVVHGSRAAVITKAADR